MQSTSKLPALFLKGGEELLPAQWKTHCYRCGKALDLTKAVVLQEDIDAAEFHDYALDKSPDSAGMAIFGPDCAIALRKRVVQLQADLYGGMPTSNTADGRGRMMTLLIEKLQTGPSGLRDNFKTYLEVLNKQVLLSGST